jgi:predicted peroxiredoxin
LNNKKVNLLNRLSHHNKIFNYICLIVVSVTIVYSAFFPLYYPIANAIANPIVYHLSSDEPWRATVAISDATTLLKLGHNVTLLLSVEGVQLGVIHPHHYLGLDTLTGNVTNFIANGGKVIICEVCLRIAGYNNTDIINGAIVGQPEIISNLLSNATVIDY